MDSPSANDSDLEVADSIRSDVLDNNKKIVLKTPDGNYKFGTLITSNNFSIKRGSFK